MRKTKKKAPRHRTPERRKISEHRIGRYIMFDALIHVYAVWGNGGSSEGIHGWQGDEKEQKFIVLKIGMFPDSWPECVRNALHEVLEEAFRLARCEFQPLSYLGNWSTGRFTVMANHEDFTVICNHTADMFTYLLLDLEKHWKAERRNWL